MSCALKINWVVWLILTLFVIGGAVAFHISGRGTTVALTLTPGHSAEAATFRLLSAVSSDIELRFERAGIKDRNELGTYKVRGGWKEGYIEFLEPGAPVKIQLSVGDDPSTYIFEAGPAFAYNNEYIYRLLLPFLYEGDLQHYPWRASPTKNLAIPKELVIPRGNSVIHVTVLDVAAPLRGESAVVVIPAPLGIKRYDAGYGILAPFLFWPVYAFLLAAYGIFLAGFTIYLGRASSSAHSGATDLDRPG